MLKWSIFVFCVHATNYMTKSLRRIYSLSMFHLPTVISSISFQSDSVLIYVVLSFGCDNQVSLICPSLIISLLISVLLHEPINISLFL